MQPRPPLINQPQLRIIHRQMARIRDQFPQVANPSLLLLKRFQNTINIPLSAAPAKSPALDQPNAVNQLTIQQPDDNRFPAKVKQPQVTVPEVENLHRQVEGDHQALLRG